MTTAEQGRDHAMLLCLWLVYAPGLLNVQNRYVFTNPHLYNKIIISNNHNMEWTKIVSRKERFGFAFEIGLVVLLRLVSNS
jgi:hypothetical protein